MSTGLPPQDLSGDTTRRYLVDGLHDALIGELAGTQALRVISRTSTLRLRTPGRSVPELASELGVDALVEVSTSRVGDSVSLRLHLIQARPVERDLGSDAFARDQRRVLTLYRAAAHANMVRLHLPLTRDEAARLAPERNVDPAAYDAYLRGMSILRDAVTAADISRGLGLREVHVLVIPEHPGAGDAVAPVALGRLGSR
jgi:TolB-like protein